MDKNNVPSINIDVIETISGNPGYKKPNDIDHEIETKLISRSEEAYQEITNRIIDETKQQLNANRDAKKNLRIALCYFVMGLLAVQFIFLMVALILNKHLIFISDDVISTYIVSVFAETLVGLIIMVSFAFKSNQEVELIKILNLIVSHFQKYNSNRQG